MASTIKIKRSAGAAGPSFDAASGQGKVAAGELAWVHGTGGAGSLYIGSATGSAVEVIGGKPGSAYCASIFANTPLTGTTQAVAITASGAISCAGFTATGYRYWYIGNGAGLSALFSDISAGGGVKSNAGHHHCTGFCGGAGCRYSRPVDRA